MSRHLLRYLHTVCAIGSVTVCLAANPEWWLREGIIQRDVAGQPLPVQDYAVINQGQLKNFVRAAVREMNVSGLPDGAGPVLNNLIASWASPGASTQDYTAVNLGQLKNTAKPFYDRLMAWGLVTAYPWQEGTATDYALANIGQVKNLFNWDLSADLDLDSMGDKAEIAWFGNLSRDGLGDFDQDGVEDRADAYPLDPARSALPGTLPGDVVAPDFIIFEPTHAVMVP